MLAAVSHDLRTPLASIKALTSGWLEPDVDWSRADTDEFMRSIDAEADRLNKLVENLLDMSRLQSGALELASRPSRARRDRAGRAREPERTAPIVCSSTCRRRLPRVDVDPALARTSGRERRRQRGAALGPERSRFASKPRAVADRVDLRVVDRGCGIPLSQRGRVFQPFQRLGDTASDTGVGLGLAVARGFVDAVGGELTVEDTPGGGVTMVIGLPIATRLPTEECAS